MQFFLMNEQNQIFGSGARQEGENLRRKKIFFIACQDIKKIKNDCIQDKEWNLGIRHAEISAWLEME